MLTILLVSAGNGSFSGLQSFFEKFENIRIQEAVAGNKAISAVLNEDLQLMIVDEVLPDMTGLELVEKCVVVNPMLNCALVSSLSKGAFHEASEGLGVLMQLPPQPGEIEGRELLKRLKKVLRLDDKIFETRGESAE
ncbi:MAG: hypothetical protein K9K64_15615 [Desulfohalobiaceae bacterium]|nr:hypothetical protein [Desulfohalobiaceae bacterium]